MSCQLARCGFDSAKPLQGREFFEQNIHDARWSGSEGNQRVPASRGSQNLPIKICILHRHGRRGILLHVLEPRSNQILAKTGIV